MRPITAGAIALAIGTSGCTAATPGEEYAGMIPDDRVRLDVPTDGGLRGLGDVSESYINLRNAAEQVNGGLAEMVAGVREITSFDPTWSDEGEDTALWGPWDSDDGLTMGRLWVKHHDDRDSWGWAMELRPLDGGEDDWVPVVAGEVDPGGTPQASAGVVAVDFDTIAAHGAGDGEVGFIFAEYVLRPGGATVTVSFDGFGDGGSETADAAYSFDQTDGEGGRLDLAYTVQVVEGGEPEIAVVRSRWVASGAGRADMLLTSGDFGPLAYRASECWDDAKLVVFYEDNANFDHAGDEGRCRFAEADFPSG